MAISVTWATTKIIFIPKADLTLLQASPEVRQLDLDAFRLELNDLMASATEGISWPTTHEHTGEKVLSGVTYARFVEIVGGYTVEFEDGTYTVSVVGGNTNLGDVKVANQVSLVLNNSAGLVNQSAILNRLDYGGFIWLDTINGSAGTIFGTNGTPGNPVDNFADAQTLASDLGARRIRFVSGSATLTASLEDYEVVMGKNAMLNAGSQSLDNSEFRGGELNGTMTGSILASETLLNGVSGFLGEARRCGVKGTITLGSGLTVWHDCHSDEVGAGSTPIVDFVGAGRTFSCRDYDGGIEIRNMTDVSNVATLDMGSGQVILHTSNTAGEIVIRDHMYPLTDNSAGTTVTLGVLDRTRKLAQIAAVK